MSPAYLLDKTDKGQDEIKSRKNISNHKMRMLLLLVDGTHTIEDLSFKAGKLGIPEAINDLVSQGFIAPRGGIVSGKMAKLSSKPVAPPAPASTGLDAQSILLEDALASLPRKNGPPTQTPPAFGSFEHYNAARIFMSGTIVSALGLKSFFFTLKIEKTENVEGLRLLFADYAKAITKAMGEEAAKAPISRMRAMLN